VPSREQPFGWQVYSNNYRFLLAGRMPPRLGRVSSRRGDECVLGNGMRNNRESAMVRAEYIVRTVIAAAVLAVTWWNAVARVHNAHVESPTLGFRDYILLGLVFGAAACFALKILLPLRRCRRLSPITWVFVFTVSGWLAGSQIQTKAELVFDSWPPRPCVHHHFPRGWPFAMVDTVIVHEQRPDGLLERGVEHQHGFACREYCSLGRAGRVRRLRVRAVDTKTVHDLSVISVHHYDRHSCAPLPPPCCAFTDISGRTGVVPCGTPRGVGVVHATPSRSLHCHRYRHGNTRRVGLRRFDCPPFTAPRTLPRLRRQMLPRRQ